MSIWKHSATEIAGLFASGEASAREIVDAHLARIDEVNGPLNAVVSRIDGIAYAAADEADKAKAAGKPLGPLAGVPFTIKSNLDVTGSETTFGLNIFAEATASSDAPVVERMRQAGAIPLARTNMPDLGLRVQTDSQLYGLTNNPWKSGYTVGGSSGGEGVALATGMSPIGLGNDLGGSVRNPASCCSIASIKPTSGCVPNAAEIVALPNSITLQQCLVNGPMARNVNDVRLGLEVLAGVHPRDPLTLPIPLTLKPGQKRVAVLKAPPGGDTDPRVAEIVMNAARALEAGGVIVEEVDIPFYEATSQCWVDVVIGVIATGLEGMTPLITEDANNFMLGAVEAYGPTFTPEQWQEAWVNRVELLIQWNAFFAKWDAVLTPTWTQLPLLVNDDATKGPEGAKYALETARPVFMANILGTPSAAVPAGLVDGLPVGVLLNGQHWSDLTCLELAKIIEDAKIAPAPLF